MKFTLSALIMALLVTVSSGTDGVGINPDCEENCACGDKNGMFVKSTFTLGQAACEKDEFSTLCAALKAADLLDAVSDPKSAITVFAPTNDAFANLGQETLDYLTGGSAKGKKDLQDILLLHVAAPILTLEDLECGKKVNTLLEQQTKTECKFTAGGTRGMQVGLGQNERKYKDIPKPELTGETLMCNGIFQVVSEVILPGSPGGKTSFSKSGKNEKKKKSSSTVNRRLQ